MTAKHYYFTISIVLSPDAETSFFFAESPDTETETANGKKRRKIRVKARVRQKRRREAMRSKGLTASHGGLKHQQWW